MVQQMELHLDSILLISFKMGISSVVTYFLVLDNARIHFTRETSDLLIPLFRSIDITVYNLPAYSPELNPSELVFAYVKRIVEDRPIGSSEDDAMFFNAILQAFSKVDRNLVCKCYSNCLNVRQPV
jgi:transposase